MERQSRAEENVPVSAEPVPLPDPATAVVGDGFPDARGDALAAIPTQARSDAELLALWESEAQAAAARAVLEPEAQRLLGPLWTAPTRVLGRGPVLRTDLAKP
jgi:hypothetical protein